MLNKNNDQQLLKILDMLLEDIDIKNDFFVEELLSCTDTKLIDHIIPRYQDIISYKYNNKTIMDLVLEKINMLKCSVHSNGFIESESTIKTNITTKKEIEYLNYFRKIGGLVNNVFLFYFLFFSKLNKRFLGASFRAQKLFAKLREFFRASKNRFLFLYFLFFYFLSSYCHGDIARD